MGPKLELLRFFLGLRVVPNFFPPLLTAYNPPKHTPPPSYTYPNKDIISYKDIKIPIFFTLFEYCMTRFQDYEIRK